MGDAMPPDRVLGAGQYLYDCGDRGKSGDAWRVRMECSLQGAENFMIGSRITFHILFIPVLVLFVGCGPHSRADRDLNRLGLSATRVRGELRCENLEPSRVVRLLTYQLDGNAEHYGVYGLFGAKWSLVVPEPSQSGTVRWEGIAARAALERLICMTGRSPEAARTLVERHAGSWFVPGSRVFFVISGDGSEEWPTWPVVAIEPS